MGLLFMGKVFKLPEGIFQHWFLLQCNYIPHYNEELGVGSAGLVSCYSAPSHSLIDWAGNDMGVIIASRVVLQTVVLKSRKITPPPL